MLRLTSEEVLQRIQMKKISGGYGGVSVHCTCHGNVGNWWGTYSSWGAIQSAISAYCGIGNGTCFRT